MSLRAKATVQVTVQVDLPWNSTTESVDFFFRLAAQDAVAIVRRNLAPSDLKIVGTPRVALVASEDVEVPVPEEAR